MDGTDAEKQSAAEPPGYGSAAGQPDGQQYPEDEHAAGAPQAMLPLELQPSIRPA